MHSKAEKRRMEDELDDLTRERNELIMRMNELSGIFLIKLIFIFKLMNI